MLKSCSTACEYLAHSSAFQNGMAYVYQIILYRGLLDRSSLAPHPATSGPDVGINTGPESHPGLRTQGSLREAARACRAYRLLPSIRVGLGWEEVTEWSQERGLARNEPGPIPLSSAPLSIESERKLSIESASFKQTGDSQTEREKGRGRGRLAGRIWTACGPCLASVFAPLTHSHPTPIQPPSSTSPPRVGTFSPA